MSKLGPYRKGKKAFRLGRQNKASIRYILHLARKRERAIFAFKLARIAVTSIMTAHQVAMIQSKPIPRFKSGDLIVINRAASFRNQKELAISECLVYSANQFQQIILH